MDPLASTRHKLDCGEETGCGARGIVTSGTGHKIEFIPPLVAQHLVMPEGMNSIPRSRQSNGSLISSVLLLAAPLAIAALLAAVASGLIQLPWVVRFGVQCLAMAAAAVPVWLALGPRQAGRPVASGHGPRSGPLADFLVVADHEMKTPLAGIKAYVELLADGDADDESTRDEFLQGICSQADRLEGAIDELLGRARLEAGLVLADTTTCNVA